MTTEKRIERFSPAEQAEIRSAALSSVAALRPNHPLDRLMEDAEKVASFVMSGRLASGSTQFDELKRRAASVAQAHARVERAKKELAFRRDELSDRECELKTVQEDFARGCDGLIEEVFADVEAAEAA